MDQISAAIAAGTAGGKKAPQAKAGDLSTVQEGAEHATRPEDENEEMNYAQFRNLKAAVLRLQQDALQGQVLAGIARPSSIVQVGSGPGTGMATSRGPDNTELVSEGEQGIYGLLARHIQVPAHLWEEYVHYSRQRDLYNTRMGRMPSNDLAMPTRRTKDVAASQYLEKFSRRGWAGLTPGKGAVRRKHTFVNSRSIFGLPIIHPYSRVTLFWQLFMMVVDIVYTAFWVPINVAFCTEDFGDINKGCTKADLLGGSIYTLNLLLGFQLGIVLVHNYKKKTVTDGWMVARFYFRHGRFWLDFLASVPFIYLIVVLIADPDANSATNWVNLLSLVRLVRMVRLISISKVVYVDSLSSQYQDNIQQYVNLSVMYIILLVYIVAVIINLQGCLLVLAAYLEGQEDSWMTTVAWTDLPTAHQPYQWYCAVYLAITTSTTTGYGDFHPVQPAEQVLLNLYMICGMVMFGLMVGTISQSLTKASAKAAQLYAARRREAAIHNWLMERDIPEGARKQIHYYLAESWRERQAHDAEQTILAELPTYLRHKMACFITADLVSSVHVLDMLDDDLKELLAQSLKPMEVPPGQDLCRQGDEADCLWILEKGDVVALQYMGEAHHLSQPCLFGESVILGDDIPACRTRFWTFRALSFAKLWVLSVDELWPILRMYPQLKVSLLEYVRQSVVSNLSRAFIADGHWCELVSCMLRGINVQTQRSDEEILADLHKASVEDNSLQALLAGLIQISLVMANPHLAYDHLASMGLGASPQMEAAGPHQWVCSACGLQVCSLCKHSCGEGTLISVPQQANRARGSSYDGDAARSSAATAGLMASSQTRQSQSDGATLGHTSLSGYDEGHMQSDLAAPSFGSAMKQWGTSMMQRGTSTRLDRTSALLGRMSFERKRGGLAATSVGINDMHVTAGQLGVHEFGSGYTQY